MVYGQLKNQGLALLKSLYSPGHRTYLDRHGIWVQHENPDRTIVEGKFGGTKTGFRSRYPTVRHGLPEVRDTGNIILDSVYLIVATLQGALH
jgi:hypothetical protein